MKDEQFSKLMLDSLYVLVCFNNPDRELARLEIRKTKNRGKNGYQFCARIWIEGCSSKTSVMSSGSGYDKKSLVVWNAFKMLNIAFSDTLTKEIRGGLFVVVLTEIVVKMFGVGVSVISFKQGE